MSDTRYTEQEINWALGELRKKGISDPQVEQAVKLLNTFKQFGKVLVDKIVEDKDSTEKAENINKTN